MAHWYQVNLLIYFNLLTDGIVPVPDKEQDIIKGSDFGKDKQTDFLDKTGLESEKTLDKTVSQEIPLSGKDKTGPDIDKGKGQELETDVSKDPGKESGKEKHIAESKDKIGSKDSDDSLNKVRKKDSDNGKIVHYLDKDGDLDIPEKAVTDQTNDLDTNIVDIVPIDDKSIIKETTIFKATEKYSKETVTEIPLYTIISLRKEEKDENVPYNIDTSSTSDKNETVSINDIEENQQTLVPKETSKIQPQAHKDNSTESGPTLIPDTKGVTAGETRQGVDHKENTPDSKNPIKEKPKADAGMRVETESRHTEKEVENLSIIGNLPCSSTSCYKHCSKLIEYPLTSHFLAPSFRGWGQKVSPTPSALPWFLRVGAWRKSRDGGVCLQPLVCSEWQCSQDLPA